MPHSRIYSLRFGSMYGAYERIGYEHGRRAPVIELSQRLRAFRRQLLSTIVSDLIAEGATVSRDLRSGLVTINNEFTLRLATTACFNKSIGLRWHIRLTTTMKTDVTLVARMAPGNESVLDYYLLPMVSDWPAFLTVEPEGDLITGVYHFEDLTFLKSLVRRVRLKEVP